MNEILDVLATRRSAPPPMLGAPGPSAEQLDRLLTIASRVPDHGKLAPWRFILFAGEGRAKAGEVIADVFAAAHPEAEPKRLEIERRSACEYPGMGAGLVGGSLLHEGHRGR